MKKHIKLFTRTSRFKFNVEEVVEKAHELGRDGDIFTNNSYNIKYRKK